MGISFNTEARLPKYMAQRAAELLIEKSELLKDNIAHVNADYDVLKPIMFAAINKYIREVNSDDFFKKVITEIEKHEEVVEQFISALKDTKIAIPAEETVENISEAMKNAVIIKLISDQATNIVDFLYSTKKRQVLADCIKPECTFYKNEIEAGKVVQFYQCSTIRECKSFQENKLRELSSFFSN